MDQLHRLISTVIASAMDRAARGAGVGDLAHGLLAGLRRIRTVVGAQAGYGAACSIEDGVHDWLVQRSLEGFSERGPRLPVPVPPPGPNGVRVSAILEDAAMSCLSLNSFFPGNSAINLTVEVIASRLVECLDGIPDWESVLDILRLQDNEDEDDSASDSRWTSAAIH